MASSSNADTTDDRPTSTNVLDQQPIPQQLKFLMSNIRSIISITLTADNYPLWRSQVLKIFKANRFDGFLDGTCLCPPSTDPTSVQNWVLIDQNLAAALYSIISPSILPYVLSLEHCSEIWDTIARRLQSSTRSRTIQLRNELHHVSMNNQTMSQYLLNIKALVDAIAATGSPLDPEEIISYTLNGLPPNYQAFKTAIKTNLQPLSLDDLYTLLCSEELNLVQEAAKDLQNLQITDPSTALTTYRGTNRGRSNSRGRPPTSARPARTRSDKSNTRSITCQICSKPGHSALKCWHRHDPAYTEENSKTALFTQNDATNSSDWFLDTGATSHLTADQSQIHSIKPYTGNQQITLGNGNQIPNQNSGKGILPTPSGNLQLQHLLHVPNLSFNLISIHRLTKDNNYVVLFSANEFKIQDSKTGRSLLTGPCRDGLYPIRTASRLSQLAFFSAQATVSSLLKYIPYICNKNSSHCNSCRLAKSQRLPFARSISCTSQPFDLLHSDVWGPAPVTSVQGARYYISFINDFSKFCWVYPLVNKSDAFFKFQEFNTMIIRQFNAKLKIFRSDGGGEFINNKFFNLFKQLGIIHQYSCAHTPPQNGVAERKHKHILETIRSLLIEANLPRSLWVEALLASVYLINRIPSRSLQNLSPYHKLYQKPATYAHLKIFGCLCYPWLKPYNTSKLSSLSTPCVFIGYATTQKGYRCLDPKSGRVYVSRHVIFNEASFPYHSTTPQQTTPQADKSTPPLLLVPTNLHNSSNNTNILPPTATQQTSNEPPTITESNPTPNLSSPQATNAQPRHHMITRSKTGTLKPKTILNLIHTDSTTVTDPTSYTEAARSEQWRRAMSAEFQAVQSQGTWDLVPPSPDQNVLGCKWTFRTKYLADGTIARHKARLVAKGFDQEHRLDYNETFSPVTKMPTIRILLVLALHHGWKIHQLDVSNAFLHGNLSHTVHMKQPPGFIDIIHPNYVCRLKKALYGLKQLPREWFATLSGHLLTLGFKLSTSDTSLFIYNKNKIMMYFLVYVDDIILTGNCQTAINTLIANLNSRFPVKDLGTISHFFGIQVVHTTYGLHLNQSRFAQTILSRAGMINCKPVSTPFQLKSATTTSSSNAFSNPTLYRHLAGSLQYLTTTRPDLSFAVNRICQHMQNPTIDHFEALKRLLRYLQGTIHTGLPLFRDKPTLRSYADTDWAGDEVDRKSTTGYCNFLGSSLISWAVKKQNAVARSSTEAEYRALATAAADIIWIRRLLQELNLQQIAATTLFCDNTSAIALANNPFTKRGEDISMEGGERPKQMRPVKLVARRASRREMRNVAAISSSFLPVFGVAIDENFSQKKKYVIVPFDHRYRRWQAFLVLLVAYSAWASPLELAFEKLVASKALIAIDLIVDAFFAVDIVVCFYVAYLDKSTHLLVFEQKKIATRYVMTLNFGMDVVSTLPFQLFYGIITGKSKDGTSLGILSLLRLWRLRHVSNLFREASRNISRYARKNGLPETLRTQMMQHVRLKFKTIELQQEEVLTSLPKAIRSSIAQHLFQQTVDLAYLFKGVSENFIAQLVSEMKAEYFPPKADIILQKEIPTEFYIVIAGELEVLTNENGTEKILSALRPADMAGEIGVILNIPQPFTIRSKSISQVVRIGHSHFRQVVELHIAEGKTILSNFLQFLKGLKEELLVEIPILTQLHNSTAPTSNMQISFLCHNFAGRPLTCSSITPSDPPKRVVIRGHHPDKIDKTEGNQLGKLVYLPDSIEELLKLAVIHDKFNSKFFILEEMLKKELEGQTRKMSSEMREVTDSQGWWENPKPIRRKEAQEIEISKGIEKMPPLGLIPKEESGRGYVGRCEGIGHEWKGAELERERGNFDQRRAELERGVCDDQRGAEFERRWEFDEKFGYKYRMDDWDT
ncbi:hypothetical protein KFK09_014261 [Dendrobium nobile]|uniref:Potassium channel n=1 Tax=Dendrobium nobile TaxID=94219 RepID=A0A8T3B9K6_DENNO|nr:hypothetical protein KFK09_014261 [Dendrobium nobile]